MTHTAYVVRGFTSYHIDPDCRALDSAQIHGAISLTTTQQATTDNRPPCIVCAGDPNATEWTVTRANLSQLFELIAPSKPHWTTDPDTGNPVVDGLTIREHHGLLRTVAHLGDTIRLRNSRYTVHPATQETQR